jgi:hypothetical protein
MSEHDIIAMPVASTALVYAGSAQTLSGFLFAGLYHLRYTRGMGDDQKKVTNERPISLFPLDFKQAVAALLKIKPRRKKKPKPKEQPHISPGFHAFNVANLDKATPEHRHKVIEHILDVMEGEEEKKQE